MVLARTLCSQTCSEGSAGYPDQVVVGGARHGAQLEEVAGHGEAEDAAHGDGGSQLGVRTADTGGQIADSLVEMESDGFGSLRHGQHGPDQGPHLGWQCGGAHLEDVGQMVCGFFRLAGREL